MVLPHDIVEQARLEPADHPARDLDALVRAYEALTRASPTQALRLLRVALVLGSGSPPRWYAALDRVLTATSDAVFAAEYEPVTGRRVRDLSQPFAPQGSTRAHG